MNIFQTAWSFSVLSVFETCRKKYYHLKVLKDAKDGDSEAAREGKEVHVAMHKRVLQGVALPVPLRQHEKIAARFANAKGQKFGEMKMCLNNNFEPVDWFAKDAWVRAIVDLLIVNGDTATIIDWKTGKIKLDWTQLRLAAAVLARLMPEINNFKLVFVWLRDSKISTESITRSELKSVVWMDLLPRVKEIEIAKQTTDFPASESGLCGWCPVTQCPHWFDRTKND